VDLEDLDLVELPSVFAGRTATKYSGPRENVGGRFRSAGVITLMKTRKEEWWNITIVIMPVLVQLQFPQTNLVAHTHTLHLTEPRQGPELPLHQP
jgi:hypothetical protein